MKKTVLKRIEQTKDGIRVPILGIEPDAPQPCRQCRNEPRLPGSSRGKVCAAAFKAHQLEQERLQKKIAEQQKKP